VEELVLKPGQTIRAYITANRYFDITHEGWTLKVVGNKGVGIINSREYNSLNIISTEKVMEDEL
jgi:hypothetical protein